jgi:hypothetical protein
LRTTVHLSHDTWIAARVGGVDYYNFQAHRDLWGRGVMAHTSPVYVGCGDEYRVFSEATAQYMLTLIEGSLTYVNGLSPQHSQEHVTHHHRERDHLEHLSRPFVEAREAVLRRIREAGYGQGR